MRAILGCPILVGENWVTDTALLIDNGRISAIVPERQVPNDASRCELTTGHLVPGFIDLQVNGGGGRLFNDEPSVETIECIAATHRRFGTTGFLPTLISDTQEVIAQAIDAVSQAMAAGVPGVLGIHIEGPVLNGEKKGVHDDKNFRLLDDTFMETLASLRGGKTLVTLAPEKVAPGQIQKLVDRGVLVWAGHTDADYETVKRAVDEGLSGFTHLYNAMSPLTSRAPGVVGAALDLDQTYAGIIADGHHVDDASLRIAIKCKTIEKMILVTDAMPSVGAPDDFGGFELFGNWVNCEGTRLTISEGNLAGSSLDMMSAVRYAERHLGINLSDAVRMASAIPARALSLGNELGEISEGKSANLVHINQEGLVSRSWIDGHERVYPAPPRLHSFSGEG
jgi:N-acetylglucosamine-6-phosphate deacetylase